uniref:C-type lectin domain-containing protein n=1 Tax=Biomphalaria glabrata TaxID=6526 RepID=A0A2C9LSJ4_BIOGL
MSCVKEGNRCSSFVFQAKTLSCVIGSTVVSTPSARSVEHTLYWIEQPVACPKRNLTLVTIDSIDSCLWFSYPVLANRSEASRNCTSNGGNLISVRSLNKLVVLRNSTFNTNLWTVGFLWIGLMFDKVNQTYYWDDDGSEINSDWQIEFFKNATILSTNDTCVSYYAIIWNSAFRYFCNMNLNYACEIYV